MTLSVLTSANISLSVKNVKKKITGTARGQTMPVKLVYLMYKGSLSDLRGVVKQISRGALYEISNLERNFLT